jgi:hypothetical protein
MFENKRIVCVTPAGRKRYLEVLIPYILRLRDVVDEYRLWVNTENLEDIEYMKSVQEKYPDFITVEYLTVPHGGNLSIYSFFKNCVDKNTVYVRFDDDVVMMDDIVNFKKFLKFRIDNPQYFAIFANILNNSVLSHLHHRFGTLNTNLGIAGYKCICDIGWKDPLFAENVHRQILEKNDLSYFHFEKPWILHEYERVSINCISWLGEEFEKFNGTVGFDEELWLTVTKPSELLKPNAIYGGFAVVHYAFHTQRNHIETTDILSKYASLSN